MLESGVGGRKLEGGEGVRLSTGSKQKRVMNEEMFSCATCERLNVTCLTFPLVTSLQSCTPHSNSLDGEGWKFLQARLVVPVESWTLIE